MPWSKTLLKALPGWGLFPMRNSSIILSNGAPLTFFVRFLEGINQNKPDCMAGCIFLEILSLFLKERPTSAAWRLQ